MKERSKCDVGGTHLSKQQSSSGPGAPLAADGRAYHVASAMHEAQPGARRGTHPTWAEPWWPEEWRVQVAPRHIFHHHRYHLPLGSSSCSGNRQALEGQNN